jgi:FkbM family methyltransferase
MNIIKSFRKGIHHLGFDVIKYPNQDTIGKRLVSILNETQVDLILDIGANKGQFGQSIFSSGYGGKILSFEPVSFVYKTLLDNSKAVPNWLVYERCCIGDQEGENTINVSNLVGNSSVLDMKSTQFNVKQSHYVSKEIVKQITLETLNNDSTIKEAKNVFLKMDIQGFEHFVLSNLHKANYNIVGFYIELSLVKLYDNQEDYLYICNFLKQFDYDLIFVEPESIRSGRMIQFNGVFLKNELSYKN